MSNRRLARPLSALFLAVALTAGAFLSSGYPIATAAQAETVAQSTQQLALANGEQAEASTGERTTHDARLTWGISEGLRASAANGPTAAGTLSLLGTVEQAEQAAPFVWTSGTGSVVPATMSGDVVFGEEDGVQVHGHPDGGGDVDGDGEIDELDLRLTSPRIVMAGPEQATLVLDVQTGEAEQPRSIEFAHLTLATPQFDGDVLTWNSESASLTEAGAAELQGLLVAGEELDPVTIQMTLAPTQAENSDTQPGEETGEHGDAADDNNTDDSDRSDDAADDDETPSTSPEDHPADVDGASLQWGVKKSFRNYVENMTMFEGRTTLLGSTEQRSSDGVYLWDSGAGTAAENGSTADVSFGAANGVRFQSHPMTDGGKRVYALDLQFTNPRVVVTSPTEGELRMDVSGRRFISMTQVGPTFEKKDVALADLAVPSPTEADGDLLWTDIDATLTRAGEDAFGGFYEAGEVLDSLTVSAPIDGDISVKKPTTTSLSASAKKVSEKKPITFRAAVSPKLAGTVTFSSNGKRIGKPVPVKKGAATVKTSLPRGMHSVRATFTPDDDAYGHSNSNSLRVAVTGAKPTEKPRNGSGSKALAAGALTWGISDHFRAYVTCDNKEAYGISHCAKGDINTSGVGGGYLFPQAASSDWNRATQTGTVRYSGNVTFSGYGTTMFTVSNPSITVTSATSATLHTGNTTRYGAADYSLDLSAATKTVGANGEVTWSGVPVAGSLSSGGAGGSGSQNIGLDPLTFTVGAASAVSYGSTSAGASTKEKRTPADTPPATTGLTVITPPDRLRAGGRIEVEATGFDPDDEGILVVLYSEPILLDDAAAADAEGVVRWKGTLPKDVTGEHTLTLQGSQDAGAVITILDPKKSKKAESATNGGGVAGTTALPTRGVVALSKSVTPWEWWASAGGLFVIACCTTLLALRQRRMNL